MLVKIDKRAFEIDIETLMKYGKEIKYNHKDTTKMRETAKENKKVIKATQNGTIFYFPSKYSCAKKLGINTFYVFECCEGKRDSTYKSIKFEYNTDSEYELTK